MLMPMMSRRYWLEQGRVGEALLVPMMSLLVPMMSLSSWVESRLEDEALLVLVSLVSPWAALTR